MRTSIIMDCDELDRLVSNTYGRTYTFQQQDDCKGRGIEHYSVPGTTSDYEIDTVPENVNDPKMGVSFKAWLERDPNQKLTNRDDRDSWSLDLWWGETFTQTAKWF